MIRDKHLGIKIDNELHYKMKYVADYDGRSVSGQIIHYLRKGVREFEKENGEIEVPEKP